jgi:HD-like signal output (HDOD) protein
MMFGWLQRLFSGPANADGRARSPVMPAAAHDVQAAPATPAPPVPPAPVAGAATSRAPVSFEQLDRVDNAWNGWLFERGDGANLDINPFEAQVLEALGAIASSQQSGAALVRRMPGLIPQLLQSLRSDSFSGAALSRTISSDVVLVAEVIRLANSACQGAGAGISSVEHAVILIGQEGLRQLITSVAFRPIIDIHSGACTRTLAPRLWEHAERCAVAGRRLALDARVDPFEAFLAGLVHNVGLIVALRVMDQVAKDGRGLGSEVFCAQLARTARALTCGIGREWDFAPAVTQALAEQGAMRKGTQPSPLGRLLALSDYLCKVRTLVDAGLLEEDDPALFQVPAVT